MRYLLYIFFTLFIAANLFAQQNTNYTQYLLNDVALNPAAAGSSRGINILGGRRSQWGGIIYAPETNFAWISKDFRRSKGINYFWHGAAVFIEQDRVGIFTHFIAQATYAIHFKLNKKFNFSFGIAGGIKQTAISITSMDANDPVVASKAFQVTIPDFVPGMYFYSKKFTAGISVKNLYKNTLEQKKKIIGTTGSKLYPDLFLTFSRKFISKQYDFIYVPSIQIQSNFRSIPSAQIGVMAFYKRKVGLGVSHRTQDAVSIIIQYRPWSHVVFGFAYDITASRLRQIKGSNSSEFMFGYHHYFSAENYDRPSSGATSCPQFEL